MVKKLPVSPLARKNAKPKALSGMRLSAMASGARYKGRDDVLLVELDKRPALPVCSPAQKCLGAVDLSRAHLAATKGRARHFGQCR